MKNSSLVEEDVYTPVMLAKAEVIQDLEVTATSQHDRDTATISTHMTVVTTPGMKPEMHDQESDRESDT